jgi:phospholipid/cholesterol/gamma-HCH transport system permease protein
MGAFMLTTQFGTALTAEIANMQITEQLDALKTMKISPIYYLSLPALISGVLLAPLVFWLAVLAGTFSTYLTINVIDYLAWSSYATSIVDDFELKDALICMVKSVIFTIEIVTIAVTIGLNIEEDSAKAVGEAATKTVISCFIIVILTDLLVTMAYL